MKAPNFWWQPRRGVAAWALTPAGAVVGAITIRRMARPPRACAPVPVFCVGNPTVGGAGKTPIAIAIAAALTSAGARPVFLSRGYGGRLAGPVHVDPARHSAVDVGDEPRLLAQNAPAVIARDRAAGAQLAATLGDAIVMDDGFQNPALHKTWSALVIDGAVGLGNGAVTPAGPMRAPFAPQAARADAVIVVQTDEPQIPMPPGVTHTVRLVPEADIALHGVPALAFAGIGRPEKFFASARQLGAVLTQTRAYADHAPLTDDDACDLVKIARGERLVLLTTEKDVARLTRTAAHQALAEAAVPVRVRAALPAALTQTITAVWKSFA